MRVPRVRVLKAQEVEDVLRGDPEEHPRHDAHGHDPVEAAVERDGLGHEVDKDEAHEDAGGKGSHHVLVRKRGSKVLPPLGAEDEQGARERHGRADQGACDGVAPHLLHGELALVGALLDHGKLLERANIVPIGGLEVVRIPVELADGVLGDDGVGARLGDLDLEERHGGRVVHLEHEDLLRRRVPVTAAVVVAVVVLLLLLVVVVVVLPFLVPLLLVPFLAMVVALVVVVVVVVVMLGLGGWLKPTQVHHATLREVHRAVLRPHLGARGFARELDLL
mmetsp:Transcript_14859/g.37231  ORF Transcript_14859/g.37231 Transcript_14859/m.37231 type:complete len:278 (-) Transcript_14859:380-1213(-)